LNPEQATKSQKWNRRIAYSFFNLGAKGGGWSTPRSGRFTPYKDTVTHCKGDWVGPRTSRDIVNLHTNVMFSVAFEVNVMKCGDMYNFEPTTSKYNTGKMTPDIQVISTANSQVIS
jgi:hypothetical protein